MVQKLQFFPFYVKNKKFKNDQDVCWLEHECMKMIVWDQSKNYFHLTPKIGPLWGGGSPLIWAMPKFKQFFLCVCSLSPTV